MQFILNNNPESVERECLTVSELLRHKNYTFKMLVIKINGILVKRDAYDTAVIEEGDDVMVLHLVSGG